ncbi:MAG: REP-associated tyrosine transposase, partial [Anaerolineaceae bacterium]
FNNNENCEIFLSAVEKVRKNRPFDLDAWCILPDHIHLIITLPEDEHNYSNIIREIKKNVTKNIRLHLNDPQTVIWQDRFWEHTIRN